MKTISAGVTSCWIVSGSYRSSLSSSSPASNNAGGDAWVLEDNYKKSRNAVWRDKTPFFPFKISSLQETFSQFPVQLLLLAARSSHCLQTPLCQLQSLQAPQSPSTPLRPSLQDHVQVTLLLQGPFASEFQQDGQAWVPDRGSSTTRRSRQHLTYKLSRLVSDIGSGSRRYTYEEFTKKKYETG